MLSISGIVHMCVCQCVCVSMCVFTFDVPFKRLFAQLPKVGCQKFLEFWNPCKKSNGKKLSQIWKLFFFFIFWRFSKHGPSGPMLPIRWYVHMCVWLYVHVSVCVFTFEVPSKLLFAPLPKVGCPKMLGIRNPWGKLFKRSSLRFENCYK